MNKEINNLVAEIEGWNNGDIDSTEKGKVETSIDYACAKARAKVINKLKKLLASQK
jgi:hypothetical protein